MAIFATAGLLSVSRTQLDPQQEWLTPAITSSSRRKKVAGGDRGKKGKGGALNDNATELAGSPKCDGGVTVACRPEFGDSWDQALLTQGLGHRLFLYGCSLYVTQPFFPYLNQ